MTTYEIIYIKTGSGEKKITDRVHISTTDKKQNGDRVNDIVGVIEYFEELAIDWGTYENRNSIIEIKKIYEI